MKKSLFKVILIISCIVFSAIVIVYIINYLGKYLSFFDTLAMWISPDLIPSA